MSTPPILQEEHPDEESRLTWQWKATLGATGTLALVLDIAGAKSAAPDAAAVDTVSTIFYGMVVWPLIIIGLFAISKRFRDDRTRAVIMVSVWWLIILISLASIRKARLTAASTPLRHSNPAVFSTDPFTNPPISKLPDFAAADAPSRSPEPASARTFDFSAGSDKRLIAEIEHTQEDVYHAVVAAYAKACADRPSDPVLALERVQFVERFADAEDVSITSATEDLNQAKAYLEARFPNAPGTALYELRNYRSPQFEFYADRYLEFESQWNPADRARYFLLRAQAANERKDLPLVVIYASRSFEANPTIEAGLLLAGAQAAQKMNGDAASTLASRVFAEAEPWQKRQQMEILFDIGQNGRAMTLFAALQKSSPKVIANVDDAKRVAAGGHPADARRIFDSIQSFRWNQAKLLRDRFEFELANGSAAQALTAYRALRASGLGTDPVLRDRFSLFAKHPGLPWTIEDVEGGFLLGLLMIMGFFLSTLLLVPIHYASLLRSKRASVEVWAPTGWGLPAAWLAVGVFFTASIAGEWWLRSEYFRFPKEKANSLRGFLPGELVGAEAFSLTVLILVLSFLMSRFRGWKLLGPGTWSTGKAIGVGLAVAIALRTCLILYITVFPQAVGSEFASTAEMTRDLGFALLDLGGPFGLVTVFALVVPLLEEVMFRGVVLQGLAKHIPFVWANALQAILFGALHWNLWIFPFFVAIGVANGVMARRSSGLFPAIVCHSCNNLLACIALIRLHSVHP